MRDQIIYAVHVSCDATSINFLIPSCGTSYTELHKKFMLNSLLNRAIFYSILGNVTEVQNDIVEDVCKVSNMNANNVNVAATHSNGKFNFC